MGRVRKVVVVVVVVRVIEWIMLFNFKGKICVSL